MRSSDTMIEIRDFNWIIDRAETIVKRYREKKNRCWEEAILRQQRKRQFLSYLFPFMEKYPWTKREDAIEWLKNNDVDFHPSTYDSIFMSYYKEERARWILEAARDRHDAIYLTLDDYEILKRNS